ncbi:zinc finger matrin-type protein 5-like protein [Jimgerdemannia flammicorona]|uniref:Zinc finger matrin-type protein 5-like protein n=1 Tax=Jimgerdemannia flammicorona TaxID=994334 RepID=A0A433DGL8_9FUNG|nr:zinc finger matrin-type protein 5-like protein [Jimgerdemannia flammicorona]
MKKYYCDFCDRSIPDNPEARRKHVSGTQHQMNVKMHYDSYRGVTEILNEQMQKPPCRKFTTTGSCEYGLSCRYSHVMYDAQGNPFLPPSFLPNSESSQGSGHRKESKRVPKFKLPPGLPSDLPPSLKPPPPQGYDWSNMEEWG